MKSPGAVSNEESSLLRKRRVPGLLQLKGEHCLKASVGGTGKLCCWGDGVNVVRSDCGIGEWWLWVEEMDEGERRSSWLLGG